MSQVIQFLESLGRNPALIHRSAAEYAATVAALDASDEQREMLLDRDHVGLNQLLGGREKLLCIVFVPDEEERQDDNPQEPEPVEEAPAST